MGKALYRKYRSRSLDEIVGQQHVVGILAEALKQGRIGHAFLFTGPRGVGKTSIARILAHEINKLPYTDESTHFDIIEIDAASNRRIDDIRDLREKIHIAPASAKYKVYIIDEVHMLTGESFNALLKTLEEPPEHAIFMLATTEAHKLPATIISRTQRFHLRAVPLQEVAAHLRYIADQEKIAINDEALQLIAEHGEGSFRDSISLLDQLSSLSSDTVTAEMVEATLGLAPKGAIQALGVAVLSRRLDSSIQLLNELEQTGAAPLVIAQQLIGYLRSVISSDTTAAKLIDELLEVSKSHNPSMKLLTVIAITAGEKQPPRSIAQTIAPMPVLSAPVDTPVKPPMAKMTTSPKATKPTKTAPETTPDALIAMSREIIADFDWSQIIEALRQQQVSVYGVLKYATADYDEGLLKLYFTYALHRKKMDDTKYRTLFMEVIVKLYGQCPEIETIFGQAPPKDETAASVAAIMGGGEEVNV